MAAAARTAPGRMAAAAGAGAGSGAPARLLVIGVFCNERRVEWNAPARGQCQCRQ